MHVPEPFKLSHEAVAAVVQRTSKPLELSVISLIDRFCFALVLPFCLVVYVVTCKDVPTMVLFVTPVCGLGL